MRSKTPILTTSGGAPMEDIQDPVLHRKIEIQKQPPKNSPIYRQEG